MVGTDQLAAAFQQLDAKQLGPLSFSALYRAKLWYELSEALQDLFISLTEQDLVVDIFENIVLHLRQKLDPIAIVQMWSCCKSRECPQQILEMLPEPESGLESNLLASFLLALKLQQIRLANSEEIDILNETKIMDKFDKVYSQANDLNIGSRSSKENFISLNLELSKAIFYYKKSQNSKFCQTAINLLNLFQQLLTRKLSSSKDRHTIVELKIIDMAQIEKLPDQICLAALLSENIFSFAEILENQPIANKANPNLLTILSACHNADWDLFEKSLKSVSLDVEILKEKMHLLSFLKLARSQCGHRLSFSNIAQGAKVEMHQIESLVLKAAAKNLISAQIDQVSAEVQINFTVPEELTKNGLIELAHGFRNWKLQLEPQAAFC